jgi:protease PrsW
MTMLLISLALALLPAWLLIRYFVNNDKYPEPPQLIKKTFWRGVGTVIPVLIVALPLSIFEEEIQNLFLRAAYKAFATAAIPEEFFKYCVLYYFCSKLKEFDEPIDGIVYGATVSLGFAALENVIYSIGDIGTGLLRAVTAVPGHAAWGGIMGYHFARSHFAGQRPGFFHKALFVPILLHGFYDLFLFVIVEISVSLPEGQPVEDQDALSGLVILGCVVMCVATLVLSVTMVRGYLKEMQAEQSSL